MGEYLVIWVETIPHLSDYAAPMDLIGRLRNKFAPRRAVSFFEYERDDDLMFSKILSRVVYGLVATIAINFLATSPVARADATNKGTKLTAALNRIRTVTGETVFTRINNCRLRLDRDASWVDVAPIANPQIGARVGDLIIQIVFDAPPIPGNDPKLYHDLGARWLVRDGKPTPNGGWADWLQNKPAPIGSSSWLNC